MKFYGVLYRFCRCVIRLVRPTYRVDHQERLIEPAVYLCRHYNTHGVFMTMPWLNMPIHPWSLHVYHDKILCYRQMMDYTLTKRFGWPNWKAGLTARAASSFLPRLMRSARAIPVYRGSMKILHTYHASLAALLNSESLLIFPDRDYTSQERNMGDMYEGFLAIDRLYFRQSGRHIPFVTLYADPQTHILHVGEPILFSGNSRDPGERAVVYQAIKRQLSGLPPEKAAL
ncbi:MAG: hypothetical protein VB070_08620 [Clostridiaceae bacterium]|nr:hypothetical protein [Clostridiaceae bacterium]